MNSWACVGWKKKKRVCYALDWDWMNAVKIIITIILNYSKITIINTIIRRFENIHVY